MTDHMHPIDTVEDITPDRLHHEARILAEQGRESPAHVVGLCAERIAELEAKLAKVGELERFDVDYDACEGMYRVPAALGDFVDADDLEILLEEKGSELRRFA